MITITYISKDRPNHLKKSVRSLFVQTVLPEHIVITDCSDDKVSMEAAIEELKSQSVVPITFIWKPKEELSRSQGRSLGRQYVKTPIAVSTESDIFFPPKLIEETLKVFGNSPQKAYVQPTNAWEEEDGKILYAEDQTITTGFFQAYRVEDFDNIGGYNPYLKGWGWEDIDFSQRMRDYTGKHIILKQIVTHMWHVSYAGNENNNEMNIKISLNSHWDNNMKQWFIDPRFTNISKEGQWDIINRENKKVKDIIQKIPEIVLEKEIKNEKRNSPTRKDSWKIC